MGSDLVFDIDIPMDFLNRDALDRAKEETSKLVNFLTRDFGFHKNELEINFSGSKGYHIHISTPEVLELGGDERKEILDFVTLTGLDRNLDGSLKHRIYGDAINFLRNAGVEELREMEGVGKKTAEKIIEKRKRSLNNSRMEDWLVLRM